MIEGVRILLVAGPSAPIRSLAPRLQDPQLEVLVCGSAREALDRLGAALPDVVVLDGTLARSDLMRLYSRLRASVRGSNVPILFTSHDESDANLARTTAPDFYVGSDTSLDEVEQLLFSFLPESLFDELPVPAPFPTPIARPMPSSGPPIAPELAPAPGLSWSAIVARLLSGPGKLTLAYLSAYLLAESIGASIDARLGLLVHAGLLLAAFFHGANLPPGPERTFLWTFWLAPLTRIYALAQPYAGAGPLNWWALTTVPMAVAGLVALKLSGQTAREAGLIPTTREAPIALLMAPVGLAVGLLLHVLLEPRPLGADLPFGSVVLAGLIAIVNPGLMDEIVYRGVLQRGLARQLGSVLSIGYVSLLYATVVPAGLLERGNFTAVLVTFALGLGLATLVARTGSVLSAAVAHASLAIGLVVLAPVLMPSSLASTPSPQGTPASADVRLPAPKPAIIVASPGTGPSPQPSPAGLPGPVASPPPAGPTPITLAPPHPAPVQGQPPAGSPGQSQAAVVRGTGGSGARLREQPGNAGAIIMVLSEGTPLLIVGADRAADGMTWRNVRAPNGNTGWIAAQFVATGQ